MEVDKVAQLGPDLKHGNFTEEDELIIKLHSLIGNKSV